MSDIDVAQAQDLRTMFANRAHALSQAAEVPEYVPGSPLWVTQAPFKFHQRMVDYLSWQFFIFGNLEAMHFLMANQYMVDTDQAQDGKDRIALSASYSRNSRDPNIQRGGGGGGIVIAPTHKTRKK